MNLRRVGHLLAVLLVSVSVSSCSFKGLNSRPLPFTKGGGDDDLRVTVVLANSTNLVPNSEVRYDEVVVGSVRTIELVNWNAKLTLGIEKGARIPADVTAKVGQKSLLGAEYLQLSSATPPGQVVSLADGSSIGLDRTGRYPETEEVLAAAAMLLNNGGLPQIRTITKEINSALTGRTVVARDLVRQITRFTRTLDGQREDIVNALRAINQLALTVKGERRAIEQALVRLPRGVETLAQERTALVRALKSVDSLSRVTDRVLGATQDGIVTNLRNLRPLTKQLADHAVSLAETVDVISFPFPIKAINNAFFGDYINLFATVQLDVEKIARIYGYGTPLEDVLSQLMGVPPTATDGKDSVDAPVLDPDGERDVSKQPAAEGTRPTDPVPTGAVLDGLLGGLFGGSR